jgi:hypothetical protein
MPNAPRPWIVTPHTPIEKLDDDLWALESEVPGINGLRRRMTIVKRSDGRLAFYNAVPMDDAARAEIEAWGKPAFLILPHRSHTLDAPSFRERFNLETYAPPGELDPLRAKLPMTIKSIDELPADPHLAWELVQGTKKTAEPILVTKSADGARTTLVFSDSVQNMPRDGAPFMMKLLGFAGTRPRVVPVWRFVSGLKDRKALRAQLERLAASPGLTRLVFSHGTTTTAGAADALRAAAADL